MATRNPGSFRDPDGNIFHDGPRIFRTINAPARELYKTLRSSGLIDDLVSRGFLIECKDVSRAAWPEGIGNPAYVVEHPRLPFVSYPYEWSFQQLKAAALHHLEFQILLLSKGYVLSDATAYNVQFLGSRPIFIDMLSLRAYRNGEFWGGHRQFCEQFLNPLLLHALIGVPHNAWFRGCMDGIATRDLERMLPITKRFSWNVFSQVLLSAYLDKRAVDNPNAAIRRAKNQRPLAKTAYHGILLQLRNWIGGLHPANTGKTICQEYAKHNSYSEEEAEKKRIFVQEFTAKTKPRTLIDLGCNTGDYSLAALEAGAEFVVGFDFDHKAVDVAYLRSKERGLAFLPLCLDAANPSPSQGWFQAERAGLGERAPADAVLALAFEHHLTIAKNIGLSEFIDWLVTMAPCGVVEFVPKSDPTIQVMLAVRDDIFDNYNQATFERLLRARARLIKKETVSVSGRTLFWYQTGEASAAVYPQGKE